MAVPSRDDLAEDRTDLAEDRTVLASERTFAGWLRTGFAATGIALAFNALFVRLEPPWVPRAVATMFLVIAVMIFAGAERRAVEVLGKLDAHRVRTLKTRNIRWIAFLSITATVALIATIWLLPVDPAK